MMIATLGFFILKLLLGLSLGIVAGLAIVFVRRSFF